MVHVYRKIDRPTKELLESFRGVGSATVHEAAGRIGAVRSCIKPLAPGMKILGPAITVKCFPMDNLMLHKAIEVAEPGDVIVADTGGHTEGGYWGDLMASSALARKIGGLVIDGGVRDSEDIIAMGFPIFSRGTCIRGTVKRNLGLVNHPILLGDVTIEPGDLVVGDDDGVVIVPKGMIADVAEGVKKRIANEKEKRSALETGIPGVKLNKLDKVLESLGMVEE
ncbi:4-carboxy-4-hydroxy-2-oxoadipate aldolase/oxaloacetate decarboxylase [Marispirochaeta aestuarii]|uniref:4-carboxy-4-hydroxy-2-oxoadipate aldolase/oxaloacetate decarboxylase n=1 Tax=Marispirochaeta aestuarii TaxID=1963862 RepID=UPI0029C6B35C|nr:4-carboxy-4-hydroxy-2-oxoadipate aldolase/oxaloacetate decarboxylase [Marispirochaeta aestuarii]